MGAEDVERQALNVFRMELLGAEVRPVEASSSRRSRTPSTRRCATGSRNVRDTYYCIGSVMGPHPYPTLVRDFQRVIGVEARAQILEREGRLPDALVACVGGGSNAIGIFHPFLEDAGVRCIGVEAAGEGLASGRHGAALSAGTPGVLHGMRTMLLLRRRRADLPGALDLGRARLSRASGPSTPTCATAAAPSTSAVHRRRGARRLPLPLAHGGHHPRARVRARGRARARARAASSAATRCCVINLSGRGDKDAPQVRELLAARRAGRH